MNDGGSIILNGSVASVKGTPAFGVYGATKAALRSFVLRADLDLGSQGPPYSLKRY
jgi:NAD(P)-dependent dehydrogenase (short-subunit alcohol dehydrogenase family)